jgi:hypothetical protein
MGYLNEFSLISHQNVIPSNQVLNVIKTTFYQNQVLKVLKMTPHKKKTNTSSKSKQIILRKKEGKERKQE